MALHDLLLADYGGLTGVRDDTMLESALAKPRQLFAYGQPTLPELGASYVAGVVKNHPFLDGNKRTDFMLGVALLECNGLVFFGSEVEATLRTLGLAAGELSEADYAAWLAKNSRPA
ncbi:MAG: type II toxin-antitoxin system death-on-curing family toxin [Candidatus Synoicihabitans palmerolidicus]|nr:type II toxin-antitoxin system death-on-curing family toxin [Candidatus Synoicihabitans palmerolidicus]